MMANKSGTLIGQAGLIGLSALMVGQSGQGLLFTAFTPGLPQMAQNFNAAGHGMAIAQQCVTIAAFGVIAGSFASGRIIEWIGSRMTILLALIVFGVFGAGGMFLNSAWVLLASRVLVGLANACMVTACINTISIVFQGNNRSLAIGISSGMGSAAALISLLIGGVLAQNFGWRETFIQFPVFALLGLVLTFLGIKNTYADVAHETEMHLQAGSRLWPYYVLAIIISAVMFMGSSQLAFLLPADGIAKATSISEIMATITIIAVPVSFTFGIIERRLGLNNTLLLGFVAVTAGLLLLGLVAIPAAAVLGAMLMGAYVGLTVPFLYHVVSVRASPAVRAKAIGLVSAFYFLGAFLNPFIFAPASAALGIHGTFTAAGIFMGMIALGLASAGRFLTSKPLLPASGPSH